MKGIEAKDFDVGDYIRFKDKTYLVQWITPHPSIIGGRHEAYIIELEIIEEDKN